MWIIYPVKIDAPSINFGIRAVMVGLVLVLNDEFIRRSAEPSTIILIPGKSFAIALAGDKITKCCPIKT